MTACTYLDKGITAADPDRALSDPHVVGCATCRDAVAQMAWICASVPRLAAAWEPRAGWESRVLAEVHREVVRPPRSRWWLGAPAAALAMAAAIVLLMRVSTPDELALRYHVERAQVRRLDARGSAAVGDTIRVTASGDAAHRALWVFRDGRSLVLACPGAAACKDGALEATFVPAVIGTYELVLLASPTPIPAPSDSFDESVAAAIRAGAAPHHQVIDVK